MAQFQEKVRQEDADKATTCFRLDLEHLAGSLYCKVEPLAERRLTFDKIIQGSDNSGRDLHCDLSSIWGGHRNRRTWDRAIFD